MSGSTRTRQRTYEFGGQELVVASPEQLLSFVRHGDGRTHTLKHGKHILEPHYRAPFAYLGPVNNVEKALARLDDSIGTTPRAWTETVQDQGIILSGARILAHYALGERYGATFAEARAEIAAHAIRESRREAGALTMHIALAEQDGLQTLWVAGQARRDRIYAAPLRGVVLAGPDSDPHHAAVVELTDGELGVFPEALERTYPKLYTSVGTVALGTPRIRAVHVSPEDAL